MTTMIEEPVARVAAPVMRAKPQKPEKPTAGRLEQALALLGEQSFAPEKVKRFQDAYHAKYCRVRAERETQFKSWTNTFLTCAFLFVFCGGLGLSLCYFTWPLLVVAQAAATLICGLGGVRFGMIFCRFLQKRSVINRVEELLKKTHWQSKPVDSFTPEFVPAVARELLDEVRLRLPGIKADLVTFYQDPFLLLELDGQSFYPKKGHWHFEDDAIAIEFGAPPCRLVGCSKKTNSPARSARRAIFKKNSAGSST